MKMKIRVLDKGNFILTGSKVLKTIQDTSTPGIDLLVRESVQNSLDAIKNDKSHCKMKFNIGSFENDLLLDTLSTNKEQIKNLKLLEENLNNNFLSISDSNTCGLLGEPYESLDKSKPNNLYNLVYDFMNGKQDKDAGGSWGIGKSVYYRYGNGICFYYSRTFEQGKYIDKLAGALIQDENKDCILGKLSSGIAFFGDIDSNNKPIPIYDREQIKEFLSIFNLELYDEEKTGTIVIIPYLNKSTLLDHQVNQESNFWKFDIIESLKMSLQRWYFSRIENHNRYGKYLRCLINDELLELNPFFSVLQSLYNGEVEGCNNLDVVNAKISDKKLGVFRYKKFKKEELFVEQPPENLPSPYSMLDIERDNTKENPQILFYMRGSGMVVTYDVTKFGTFNFNENEYLIGVFILNDNLTELKETLGNYIRLTEKANHKEWLDANVSESPYFSSRKPFSAICKIIKKQLNEEFQDVNKVIIDGANTIWQKELGKLLMPPEDFGKKASIQKKDENPQSRLRGVTKKKNIKCYCNGFINGNISYSFEVYLPSKSQFSSTIEVKTNAKDFSINDWESFGFEMPCELTLFTFNEMVANEKHYSMLLSSKIDESFAKIKGKKEPNGNIIYAMKGLFSIKSRSCIGYIIDNPSENDLKFKVSLLVKPKNLTYSIGFKNEVLNNNPIVGGAK